MGRRDYYTFSLLFYVLTYVFMTSTLFFISADNYQEQIYWDIKGYLILFALLVPSLLTAILFRRSHPSGALKLKILSSYISLAPILALTPLAGGSKGVEAVLLGYLLLYGSIFTLASPVYRKYTVFFNLTAALLFMLGLTLRFGSYAWLSFTVGASGVLYGLLRELFDGDALTVERKATRMPVVAFISPIVYHALLMVFFAGNPVPLISIDVAVLMVVLKIG